MQPPIGSAVRYVFDDFELDEERWVLHRGGEPVRVEPRVLELLAYVLAHRDRLVSREELDREVWAGRVVSDSALARCVYQARRALGDDADRQRYLRTVHGRGIRFADDVAVEELPPGVPVDAAPPAAPDRGYGRRGPGRAARWGVAAVVVAVAATALAVGFQRARPDAPPPSWPASPPPAIGRPHLALLPPAVAAGATPEEAGELALAGLSLSDLLGRRLAALPGLDLRLPAAADVAAGSLREVAEAVGATHVLTGSLAPAEGDRARIELALYELLPGLPARTTPLGTFALPRVGAAGGLAEFLRVRDAIAARAARVVGTPFVAGPEPGATADAEAWRFYVLAYQRLSDDFCGGTQPAIALLERALERDPGFGLAWEALGTAHFNRVWACGEDSRHYELAFAAMDRASAVAPDLPVPRFTRIALLVETGRIEEAYAAVREELARAPDLPLALNAESYALRYAGFLAPSAAALDRLLELDPLVFAVGALGGSPNTYLYQGRHQRFLAVVPLSEMAYHRWYRGFVHVLDGRREVAREVLEPAFRSSPGQVFGRLAHALLAVLDDDPVAARAIVAELARQRDATGAADGEVTFKQAQVAALAGDRDLALAELAKAVEQGFFCPRCLAADPALAAVRDDRRFARLLAAARARHLAFAERFGLTPEPG